MTNPLLALKISEYNHFLLSHAGQKGYGDGYAYALGAMTTLLEYSAGKTVDETIELIEVCMKRIT